MVRTTDMGITRVQNSAAAFEGLRPRSPPDRSHSAIFENAGCQPACPQHAGLFPASPGSRFRRETPETSREPPCWPERCILPASASRQRAFRTKCAKPGPGSGCGNSPYYNTRTVRGDALAGEVPFSASDRSMADSKSAACRSSRNAGREKNPLDSLSDHEIGVDEAQ